MASKKTTTQSAEPIDTALASGVEAMKEGFEKAVKGYDQIVAFGKDNCNCSLGHAVRHSEVDGGHGGSEAGRSISATCLKSGAAGHQA